MNRTLVSSSNLVSVGYDEDYQILEVEFKKSGIYSYQNVPLVIFQALMSAPSIGTFFNAEVKNTYPCQRIG